VFGFLNIYKPKGLTSHDVVARLRRITKIKQIGHTGTLDPFAEGVLPICIGKATRLIEYLEDDKAYEGVIQFGSSTNTYDLEGEITNSSDKNISQEDIENALENFRGNIVQKPPVFSAIKVNGKKLYEYARKGEEVEVPTREVTIYKLELIEFNQAKQQARVLIECSKGTYIRSIANDLGEFLGCYGHLVKLIRVKAGKFLLNSTLDLENLDIEKAQQALIEPIKMLNYKHCIIDESELKLVKNGMKLKNRGFNNNEFTTIIFNQELISIAQCIDNQLVQKKVFI
jgi:tRNA pseudouridine55 synthase